MRDGLSRRRLWRGEVVRMKPEMLRERSFDLGNGVSRLILSVQNVILFVQPAANVRLAFSFVIEVWFFSKTNVNYGRSINLIDDFIFNYFFCVFLRVNIFLLRLTMSGKFLILAVISVVYFSALLQGMFL